MQIIEDVKQKHNLDELAKNGLLKHHINIAELLVNKNTKDQGITLNVEIQMVKKQFGVKQQIKKVDGNNVIL